jgi:DNA-binding beta-propeller fold protein YncE
MPEVKQQLPAAKHNRRNGLRDMACGGKYVYVASYLRNRIEVIDREAWQRVASLKLPHRPQALAASPDGSRLAILQSGNRELMLVEPEAASGFSKTRHIDAVASASDLEWLDESRIALLARGKDSIFLVNLAADEEKGRILPVKLPTDINGMVYHPSTEKLYVLSGNSKRVYEIDPASGSYETISLEEDLDYPSFLATLDANRLAVGSETDGRIAVLDLPSGDISSRIQSNLPPKLMLQLTDTTGRKSVSGELKEKK